MATREHTRIVEVMGKRYRITDFDALSGGGVFLFATKKIIPLLNALDMDFGALMQMNSTDGFGKIVEVITPVLDSISQEDLRKFMSMCLEQVEIELPAGFEKVMRRGEFTVDEVKYNVKLAFLLCYHALEGIIRDFFGESALNLFQKVEPKDTKS